ncbi:MAG: hypothetical protein P1U75_19360 [Antarcticimicrobium sp.]|uniref:hypothetical protein n=1 Tax=Antarcticimicrobium sp. TaxID=2824147 RepID=UPI002601B9D2|nr:hypothetical protein [Antarcticimicrobium sp.]MDF1718800.1 hypothetical protein [Antarcticimicrobium sp.]
MFDKFVQASFWRHDLRRLFGQPDLLTLQLFDPCFIRLYDGRARRFDDPIHKRIGLALNVLDLGIKHIPSAARLRKTHSPNVDEHRPDQLEELLGGLQGPKNRFRPVFNFCTQDRFALGYAMNLTRFGVGVPPISWTIMGLEIPAFQRRSFRS